jgi:hypothetical protein
MSRENSVWLRPSATTFSCLCEVCLDIARADGISFLEVIRSASVHGALAADTDVGFVHCAAGHQVVVRRVDRPAPLTRRDVRQLQLT